MRMVGLVGDMLAVGGVGGGWPWGKCGMWVTVKNSTWAVVLLPQYRVSRLYTILVVIAYAYADAQLLHTDGLVQIAGWQHPA